MDWPETGTLVRRQKLIPIFRAREVGVIWRCGGSGSLLGSVSERNLLFAGGAIGGNGERGGLG